MGQEEGVSGESAVLSRDWVKGEDTEEEGAQAKARAPQAKARAFLTAPKSTMAGQL